MSLFKLLYTNTDNFSRILLNGYLGDKIFLKRGFRQGDPASGLIFIIAVEILANFLRKSRFRGIKITDNVEFKISQYADDLIIFLEGRNPDIRIVMQQLGIYSKFSGLKPNINKSKCMWLGKPKPPVCLDLPLQWVENLKVLGVVFNADPCKIEQNNFPDKIESIKKLLSFWRLRQLSLIGKITVIKSLAISKLVHLFISLPTPSTEMMKKLKRIVYTFLWNGKNDKIRRTKICQSYSNGGLKMIDLDIFVSSLKCSWIQRIQRTAHMQVKWLALTKIFLNDHAEKLTLYGKSMINRLATQTENKFWANVLESWAKFTECYENRPEHILSEIIWHNDHLKYKYDEIRQWRTHGLLHLSDLLNNKTLLTHQEIENKYNIRINFIDYNSIRINMEFLLRKIANTNISTTLPGIPPRTHIVLHEKKLSQLVNTVLVKNMNKKNRDINHKIERKWMSEINSYQAGTLQDMRRITHCSTMQTLHYKITNRIISTNIFLLKAGLSNTEMCSFCNLFRESPGHLFFNCCKVQSFFMSIVELLNTKYNFQVELNKISNIFPNNTERLIFGFINIVAVQCIWRSKLNKVEPNLRQFEDALITYYRIERLACILNNTYAEFSTKWEGFDLMLDNER